LARRCALNRSFHNSLPRAAAAVKR
jgi:hypothetical protein